MVDEVAEVSEATSEEAESVAAATEEQTTTITEVSESVSQVAARTDELGELLAQFDVESASRERVAAEATRAAGTLD